MSNLESLDLVVAGYDYRQPLPNGLANLRDIKMTSYQEEWPEDLKLHKLEGKYLSSLPKNVSELEELVVRYVPLPEGLVKLRKLNILFLKEGEMPRDLHRLESLEFGCSVSLPEGLHSFTTLMLPWDYKAPLPEDLYSLRSLELPDGYTASLPGDLRSLQYLKVPSDYNAEFPQDLRHLQCYYSGSYRCYAKDEQAYLTYKGRR
jgi:hypothetical protein